MEVNILWECWCVCVCICVGVWTVLLICLLLCLLKDIDWCYFSSEPFTYLFPWPNSTTCTGGHWRPCMPVFNWLLIDSAMALGDHKLPPVWKGEMAGKSVDVSVLFWVSSMLLHYLYSSHFYLCSKDQWRNTWWNNCNTGSLLGHSLFA